MSTIISDMEIRLRADIARLQSDMDAARRTVGSAMDNISAKVKSAMSMFAGLAAGLSVVALGSFIKGTLDTVDSLTDLSTRTAISVEDLAGLSYGAKLSGTELEAAAAAISKLGLNMGKESERYAKLGVTAAEPLEAFKQFADIFKSIQDPQARAAFGAEALGKSWQEAAVLLNEGASGINELIARGQELSGITTQNSADSAAFNDALDELGAVAQGVAVKIAVDLLPVLKILADEALNSSKAADAADSSFKPLTETFKATVVFGANVFYVLKTIGEEIGGIAAQIVVASGAVANLLKLDFKAAARDFKIAFGEGGMGDKMKEDAEKARQGIDEWSESVINAGKDAKEALDAVEFPDPFGIDGKIAEENAARADAFVKYAEQQAAAKKLADAAAAAAKKEQETYRGLLTTLAERIAAGKAELAAGRELTVAEKATIKLDSELASGKVLLSSRHLAHVRTLMAEADAMDKSAASAKKVRDAIQALTDNRASEYAALAGEVRANNEAIATYGMSQEAIEALTLARMEDRLARRGPQDLDLDEAEVAHLTRMIALQKEKTETAGTLGVLDTNASVTNAKELLDILTAIDAATRSAADGMTASFGRVGAAIGGLTTALSGYAVQQQAIAAQLAADKADPKNITKIAELEKAAARSSAQAKIKSYGDMAGAAKGFFKESTAGYKVMEGAEKAFRAIEMAMAIESMLTKSGLLSAFTGLFVASKATETAAETGSTIQSVLNAGMQATAWAITAVVKAIASLPFPMNLVAGAATLAAVVAIGAEVVGSFGGGGDTTAKDRQAATGTGTVLGDSSAKSESIAHSLAIMEKNSGLGLAHTISMDVSLKQVVAGIGGLGGLLVRNSGLTGQTAGGTTGSASNIAQSMVSGPWAIVLGGVYGLISTALDKLTGGWVSRTTGKIANAIFGGNTSVLDTGFTIGTQSLGSVVSNGVTASQYADTKKDGGWLHSDKYNTVLTALGEEADDQFTKVILGLRETVVGAADALGLGGAAFVAQLNAFKVDLGQVSLKDLKGDELQEALETAFSKLGDQMALAGVGGLEQYRAVGEGYLETLARVANDQMQVNDVLTVLGKSFNVTGLGAVALSQSLILAAGDLETLTTNTGYFVQNFLTEAERMKPIAKSVSDAMSKLGQSGITTVDQFKALVLAQDLNTSAGQAMYAQLIALAEPFKVVADYAAELAGGLADVAKTASEIASERKDLQAQLDQLTLSALQLRAKEREALDASNRALFDQVAARQDLATAYETESTAITATIDKLTTFAGAIKNFRDGLVLGGLSTLSPTEKAAEAGRQYSAMLTAARAGDATAQTGLTGAATAYLTASQAASGTAAQYAQDYARVQADMAIMAANVGSQLTAAQAQQIALDKQVAGLVKLNDSVNAGAATVAQAIASLGVLGVRQINGSHAGGLASVPYDGYTAELHAGERVLTAVEARSYSAQSGSGNDALLAEVKGLREDNRALKGELMAFKTQSQAENIAIAQSVAKTAKVLDRWESNGIPETREFA